MKEFKVSVSYQVYGTVTVEAENLEDLKGKLQDSDFVADMPLPDEPNYVDDSYEVDIEITEDLNKKQ